MKKVIKFVTGKRDEKQEDSGITSVQSKEFHFSINSEKGRVEEINNSSDHIVNYFEKDKSWTKLHKAAWHGNLEKLKSALKKTEIDAADSRQRTALHIAVVQGHPNIVWFLLENNAKTTIYDNEGRTPLLKAIEFGHKECISLLLERGADINEADYKGNTGLHIAVRKGSVELVATVLKKGANTEMRNNDGEYVLHTAIKLANEELLNLLLNNGAGVDVLDRFNRTPLMLAAKVGNITLMNSLIEFGAQLMLIDSQGKTAEDYAILAGHTEIAMLLKAVLAKQNKHLDFRQENNMLKIDSPNSFLQGTENIKTSGQDRAESSDVKSFFMTNAKRHDKTENETYEKNQVPESPNSHFMPPFCPSPRSWTFIQTDMINRPPKATQLEISAANENSKLYSVARKKFNNELKMHSPKISPKYTLSLDRIRKAKVNSFFVKRRFSFSGEEALNRDVKKKKMNPNKAKIDTRTLFKSVKKPLPEDVKCEGGTMLSFNNKKCKSDSSSTYSLTNYLRISNSKNTCNTREKVSNLISSPYTLDETETGSTFTQALKSNAEITEYNSWNSVLENSSSITSNDNESVNCLPKRNFEEIMKIKVFQNGNTKKAVFPQIFEDKGREILKEETKNKRVLEINKEINRQLDCYDKALKELAKSNPIKRDCPLYKYHSFPSSKIRGRNDNSEAEDKSLNNRNILSFPSFDNDTCSSLSTSKNVLLNEESKSLKSSSGESWDGPLVDVSFLAAKEKDNKSKDFGSEHDPFSLLQEGLRYKEVRLNNKTYDSDEDVSEIPEERARNIPFSPLGVIFKEIQKENESISSSRSPDFDSAVENQGISKQVLENPNSKNQLFNEEEDETNQEVIRSQSSNISLSSGSLELSGLEKDSGSEPESSHKEINPLHDFSFKIQQDLLKFNLKITTSEKIHLEELIAKMSEKSERLQYELDDAKEVTRIRDEVIKLLQHQLARMEAAYTKSLEESICSRLQITSHEQEILHLKKMCYKYEEEKSRSANEVDCKNMENLILKIKKLVSEKEKLKEEILQLEKEKLSLVNYLKDSKETKEEHQCQGWKERFPCTFKEEQIENNEKCIADENDAIQNLKETNYKKDETIFVLNSAHLEKLSNFELLAFMSNLKTRLTEWHLRSLGRNDFTFGNCKEIKRTHEVEFFPRKGAPLLSNQCRTGKKMLNDKFAKNCIVFQSEIEHEEKIKEDNEKLNEKNKDGKINYGTIDNQIFAVTLELGRKKILERKLALLRHRINSDFVRKCNVELISYQRELEKKKSQYLEQWLKGCETKSLKSNCEKLAKEQERSNQIKNRFRKTGYHVYEEQLFYLSR